MEKMEMIFKDNPTIDPPHLCDRNSEVYNGSSLGNGKVFVVVAVVFLDYQAEQVFMNFILSLLVFKSYTKWI